MLTQKLWNASLGQPAAAAHIVPICSALGWASFRAREEVADDREITLGLL